MTYHFPGRQEAKKLEFIGSELELEMISKLSRIYKTTCRYFIYETAELKVTSPPLLPKVAAVQEEEGNLQVVVFGIERNSDFCILQTWGKNFMLQVI